VTDTARGTALTALAERLRDQVAAQLATHAGSGPLPLAQRRVLAEQYTARVLDRYAQQLIRAGRPPLPAEVEDRLARSIVDHLAGAGGLQELLDDPRVENVDANGCDQVFVRYTDGRVEAAAPIAATDEELVELVRSFVTAAAFGADEKGSGEERAFDRNNPSLDLRLPDGSRLCALMSVTHRPAISVRRPTMIRADLDALARRGMLDAALCQVLAAAMRARLNLIVAGGTNTGKTTFARAAARAIPPHERLITIEDAYELELFDPVAHPNVVAMQARRPNLEGAGAVGMSALVRYALRMHPDRVIVGEARGDEVIDLLKAMSQGNDGSFATVHASSSGQAFSRLMMYAVQSPERLTFEASAMLIAEAVDLVVHLDWTPDRRRVVSGVREVVGFDGREVISNEVWRPGTDRVAVPATPLRVSTLERLEAAGLPAAVIDRVGW
jgi:Flp pilus assembly CpaF family ATPase